MLDTVNSYLTLRRATGFATLVTSVIVNFRASEIRNPVAESSAIKVA
ncbi:hypothetical protein [Mesorhizobium captivum]|nr:hypothetical protein [Mesorhizobium sp. VK3C]MDX8450597.1 hypothetical protein [Mesorhizobium sp. VK3C]